MKSTKNPDIKLLAELNSGLDIIIKFNPQDKRDGPGCFFIISGSSGVGKNTLLNFALEKVNGIYYLPSITTRQPREGEEQGNPYYFVSTQEFETMIDANLFLEWKKIHNGNYYGTHLPTISYALNNGYNIATDMDVLGYRDAKNKFTDNIVSVFIMPPSLEELKNRLLLRDNNLSLANTRLERVTMEITHKQHYDFVIINDSLERAGEELVKIIQKCLQEKNKNRPKELT